MYDLVLFSVVRVPSLESIGVSGQALVDQGTLLLNVPPVTGLCLLLMSAEQFGTNLRATVATSVPNFIRGSLIPLTILFQMAKPVAGMVGSAALTGFVALVIAALALSRLAETSNRSLDFIEQ